MIREHDEGQQRTEDGHTRLRVKAEFFYADDGMVASTNPGWLQTAFDTLTGLFDRVGLKTNVQKTVGMVCHPCRAEGVQAEKAYTWRITGAGRSYKDRQRERVSCPECGKDLARGSLSAHCQTHNIVAKRGMGQEGDGKGRFNKTSTYRMDFPAKAVPRP